MKIDEIDQKQLKSIRQDFIHLSELRFTRMESSLSPTQSDYLKLLPLLFHVNHPMLPGYVDKFAPCGIPNYTPSMLEKSIVKTVSQSFEYKPRAHLKYRIASLFLMGSMGTLGQSNSSDIDLWVCLAEPLERSLLSKLEGKGNKVKQWLATVGIELNYYLVNLDDFSRNKSKRIEVDSCGNTQNFLLLDEFYRTAVWFAGRWPLWWLVPSNTNYSQFAKRLIKQKHVDSADWIDFGEVQQIPANEYFSAALWQLYKAIDSPYKSSVKLLVLEVYARLYPQGAVLSDVFKDRVYQGLVQAGEVDPYLLILLFAEKSLIDNPPRLEFLRRAFYLKANVKIKLNKKTKFSWRYKMMAELVEKWGWSQSRLDYLNHRHQWTISRVVDERKDLVRELTHSYHFLSNFARVQGVINKLAKTELLSLGRRLYAAFERRPGKLEKLNQGIAKNIFEAAVTINHHTDKGWQLYLGHLKQNKLAINQSVFVGHSLFDCLSWGCVNGILNVNTQSHVYAESVFLNHQFATETIKDIIELLNRFNKTIDKQNFEKGAKIISFGLFLNSREDPLKDDKQQNLYRVVTKSDCLSSTDKKLNLAGHFDMMAINSWGEITTQYFSSDTAWIEFFIQYQSSFPKFIESIPVFCRGLIQNDAIMQRVVALLKEWMRLSQKSQRGKNCQCYLIAVGKKYLSICFTENSISYQSYASLNLLLSGLNDKQQSELFDLKKYIEVDPWLKISNFIQSVFSRRISDHLDCFIFQKNDQLIEVAVKSPDGSIHIQSHKNTSLEQLIGHYQQFVDKVQNRLVLDSGHQHLINYYLFNVGSAGKVNFKKLDVQPSSLFQQFALVQAIAVYQNSRIIGYDLFTSEKNYLYSEWGERVYVKLARELLVIRRQSSDYPIFLTDLDLSGIQSDISLIKSLGYKRQIEEKLNRAMRGLLPVSRH